MWDTGMGWLSDQFGELQQVLFEQVVQPLLFWLGWGNLVEDAFDATGWLLVGLIQLVLMLLLFQLQTPLLVTPRQQRIPMRHWLAVPQHRTPYKRLFNKLVASH